jgi:DNA-binding transcriptional ArsR family regulator
LDDNDNNNIVDDKAKVDRESARNAAASTSPSKIAANVDSDLRGRTLQTYLFMMKNSKGVGVRELQRSLGFSSPSVAYHHLEKLERLGLVEKDQYGEYSIVRNVDVSVLQAFSHVGSLLVPRFTFYAMFFTTLLIGYLLIFQGNSNVFAIVFGAFGSAFAWFETYRTWRKRPF